MAYKNYSNYRASGITWLEEIPAHWKVSVAKHIWKKESRPVREQDQIITAFRNGTVTLRKNKKKDGYTISEKEIGYQGVRKNDLVIHQMDAFAGAIGVSDSDGKSTPVYSVCTPIKEANPHFYCFLLREMARSNYILSLSVGIRERSTDFRFKMFGEIKVPIPPIGEQNIIASFLNYKFESIDNFLLKKQRLVNLLRERINTYIQKGVVDSFEINEKFWPTIPNSWSTEKAKRIFQEIKITNFPEEELLAVTQNKGVIPKRLCKQNFVQPTTGLANQKLVNENDFVISLRSFQGGIEFSNYKGIVSPAYTVIRLLPEYQQENFINYYRFLFKTKQFISLLNTVISGIRDGKNITWTDFSEIPIPVPNFRDLEKLENYISKYEQQKVIFEKEKKSVLEYRAAIIAEVVTGKLDVRDFNIQKNENSSTLKVEAV